MKKQWCIGKSVKSFWFYLKERCGFMISDEKLLNEKYNSSEKRYYCSIFWGGRSRKSFEFNKFPFLNKKLERIFSL